MELQRAGHVLVTEQQIFEQLIWTAQNSNLSGVTYTLSMITVTYFKNYYDKIKD